MRTNKDMAARQVESSIVASALYEGRPLLAGVLHVAMAGAVTVHALNKACG
jgi:hypothetical protein